MSVQRKYKSGAQKRKERKLKAVPPANNRTLFNVGFTVVSQSNEDIDEVEESVERQFSSECSDNSTSDSESAACSLEDENCTQNDSHEDNENNEDILEGIVTIMNQKHKSTSWMIVIMTAAALLITLLNKRLEKLCYSSTAFLAF